MQAGAGRSRRVGRQAAGSSCWNLLYFSPFIVQQADKKQSTKRSEKGERQGLAQELHSLAMATQPMQVNRVSGAGSELQRLKNN